MRNKIFLHLIYISSILLLCSLSPSLKAKKYKTIEWVELMPKDDLDALLNPPDYITNLPEGAEGDVLPDKKLEKPDNKKEKKPFKLHTPLSNQPPKLFTDPLDDPLSSQFNNDFSISNRPDNRYEQALMSTRIIKSFDKKLIRIPGYVVPLEFTEDLKITEFFLVPYFGACLHLPPPPPNQIIYVKYKKGLKTEVLFNPFWVTGTVSTKLKVATDTMAAYQLKADKVVIYSEDK